MESRAEKGRKLSSYQSKCATVPSRDWRIVLSFVGTTETCNYRITRFNPKRRRRPQTGLGRRVGREGKTRTATRCLSALVDRSLGGKVEEGLRGTAVLCANPDQTSSGSASFAASGDISVLSRHHA